MLLKIIAEELFKGNIYFKYSKYGKISCCKMRYSTALPSVTQHFPWRWVFIKFLFLNFLPSDKWKVIPIVFLKWPDVMKCVFGKDHADRAQKLAWSHQESNQKGQRRQWLHTALHGTSRTPRARLWMCQEKWTGWRPQQEEPADIRYCARDG